VPLGFTAYLAFPRLRSAIVRLLLAVALGITLSASVEMLQLYIPGRRSSIIDVANNTVGTLFGVIVAMLLESTVRRKLGQAGYRKLDRPALFLLTVFLSSLTFPFFPVMWLSAFKYKIAQMLHPPSFHLIVFLTAMASWYAVAWMLRTVSVPPRLVWISFAVIPAQLLVLERIPTFSEALGAVVGLGLAARYASCPVAPWVFLATIAVRGLMPLRFGPFHALSFVPFGAFMDMRWETGTQLLLEKSWYYGAAIWLLRAGSLTLNRATATVVVTLAAVEIFQMYIPGRTPDITDPILALLLGLTFRALRA
jgi:VanZ family protein